MRYGNINEALYNIIVHADEKQDFKYYAKVPISSKKNRYFYSKDEYLAYMKNKGPTNQNSSVASVSKNKNVSTTSIGTEKDDKSRLVDKAVDFASFLLGGKIGQTVVKSIREKIEAQEQHEKSMAELEKDNPLPQLKLKTEASTKDEDQGAVNPMYDGYTYEYSNNCSFCTMTYDLRQRGYDVEANPADPNDPIFIEEIVSWYDGAEPEDVVTLAEENDVVLEEMTLMQAAELFEEDVLKEGDGARGHFIVYWANGGAHDVIWEVDNGEVWLRDCQINEKIKPIDYIMYSNYFAYFRSDNIRPNEKCLKTVSNKK